MVLDRYVLALDVARVGETLAERGGFNIASDPHSKSHTTGAALLRPRRQRPRGRRAADERDELAALSFDHLVGDGE